MLIAIVLSLLVMIVWSRFFAPKPKPPESAVAPQQAAEHIYEQQPAERPQVEFQPAAESVSPEVKAGARDVVIKTPYLGATFTTLGGELVSLQLPKYQSKRGGNVEMVPQVSDMQWPLALKFHAAQFGLSAENFIYDHVVYEPSDPALQKVTADADAIVSSLPPATGADDVRPILEQRLSHPEGQEDLRSLIIAAVANELPKEGAAEDAAGRAQALSESTILIFSHQVKPNLRLVKGFVFGPAHYSFVMHVIFRNTGDTKMTVGDDSSSYSIIWAPSLESPEISLRSDELIGFELVGKNYTQKAIRKLKEEKEFPGDLKWIGLKRKYFFVALEPVNGLMNAAMKPLRGVTVEGTIKSETKAEDLKQLSEKKELVGISLNMRPMTIRPHDLAVDSVRICVGPMLKQVLDSCGPEFGQIHNFGFFDIFGKMLLAALLWFNKAVQNYGLAIILLTVVVRLGLFPLNQKSYRSMRAMQALQPKVNELREKYKKNPQEMNKKMMGLYRENKVNPMGGCLPMAFQMPIFIALFQALRNAVELRGAHFLWIADLSEPDKLFTLTQPFHFSVNLLPLLVIVAMLVQQKMTPMAGTGQSETQQKMMQYMPVIFGFLFYSMPSGLTVYFLVSTVLGLVQQYFVQKAA